MASVTLAELLVKVGADISNYTQGIDQVLGKSQALDAGLNHSVGATESLMASLDSLGSSLTRIGVGMTAAITLPILGVGVAALKMSSDLQSATIAFTQMMGSADMAKQHLDALRSFAMATPFEFTDLVTASKRLQALGFDAKQVIPTLTAIGDAAANLGLGAEGINRIGLALGQMQAKGKVSAQEMNQLAEAGIKAWDILADAVSKATGKSTTVAETMKMAEKGMIDGAVAVQALLAGLEDKNAGAMKAQMTTITGMFSNLKDQAGKVLVEIGDALTPIGKHLIESFTGVLATVETVIQKFKELPLPLQDFVLGTTAVAAATGPAILAFGTLAGAAANTFKAFEAISKFGSGMFGGLAETASSVGTTVGAAGTLANAGWSTMAVTIGGIAVGLAALAVGGVLAWSQLQKDTEGLRSLDAGFHQLLLDSTAGSSGPVLPGQNRFEQGIRNINSALEAGMIDLVEYKKLMLLLDDNMEKAAKADRAAGFGFKVDTSAVPTAFDALLEPGSFQTARAGFAAEQKKKSLINAPKAKPYEQILGEAFGAFGDQDLNANVKRLQDAYKVLEASGKATAFQLERAWEKVGAAIDAAAYAAVKFGAVKYADAKPFDMLSLPTLDEQIGRAAELQLVVNQYKDLKAAEQAAVDVIVHLRTEQAQFIQQGRDWATESAALSAKNPDIISVPGVTTVANKQQQDDALATLAKQVAATHPFNVDFSGGGEKLAEGFEKASVAEQKLLLGTDALNAALKTLGITARDDSGAVQAAFQTAAQAYQDGKIGVVEYEKAQLASIQNIVAQNRAAGIQITAEQSSAIFSLQEKLSKANKDVWGDVHKEVLTVMNTLDQGLAEAIVHFKNFSGFLGDMMKTFKKMGEEIVTMLIKDVTKPFADALAKAISDAIAPVISKVSGALSGLLTKGGSSIPGIPGIPGLGGGGGGYGIPGVDGMPGIDSLASGGGGLGSAAGGIGSFSGIMSIANLGVSVAAGITAGIQQAHANSMLDKIEESTRRMDIATEQQPDSVLNDLHMIRNILNDFTKGGAGFAALIDLAMQLTDKTGTVEQIRDYLYNPMGPTLSNILTALTGGAGVPSQGEAAKDVVPPGAVADIVAALTGTGETGDVSGETGDISTGLDQVGSSMADASKEISRTGMAMQSSSHVLSHSVLIGAAVAEKTFDNAQKFSSLLDNWGSVQAGLLDNWIKSGAVTGSDGVYSFNQASGGMTSNPSGWGGQAAPTGDIIDQYRASGVPEQTIQELIANRVLVAGHQQPYYQVSKPAQPDSGFFATQSGQMGPIDLSRGDIIDQYRASGVPEQTIQELIANRVLVAGHQQPYYQVSKAAEPDRGFFATQSGQMGPIDLSKGDIIDQYRASGVPEQTIQELIANGVLVAGHQQPYFQVRSAQPSSYYTSPYTAQPMDSGWTPISYTPGPGATDAGKTVNLTINSPVFQDQGSAKYLVDLIKNQV